MLTVAEALAAVTTTVQLGPVVKISLDDGLGQVLAEAVICELDSPPFDKALMDGYALRAADVRVGSELEVIEEVTAGRLPTLSIGAGQASRIMTGAPLPAGANAVVPVEETTFQPVSPGAPLGRVTIRSSAACPPGQFILKQGAAVQRGAQVMPPGRVLRAQEVAALAELGYARVKVVRRARIAILATGDELVPAEQTPGPGQIRNSNEPMLAAQVQQLGAEPVRLGVAKDNRESLRERIQAGLKSDFLLLSGGVSAGKLDLVPSELEAAGVQQVFHKIQMKPGKPLWFGIRPATAESPACYVFGLPGNPVSSMVCCELFVRAAIRHWSGLEPAIAAPRIARLAAGISVSNNRPTYHPARLDWTAEGPIVSIVDWIGSSDLCATVDANCMAFFPAGDRELQAGETLEVFPWSE
ncbi:MAG: gephyrin-like molybdotransferase Glp [Planctomycetota bacterium]